MKTLILAGLASVFPALAVASVPVDNYGVAAISQADYGLAASLLTKRLVVAPADPAALVNLGYVYRHMNRSGDANAAYVRVLQRSNVRLATDNGPVWSHDVAKSALRGEVTIASR